jgi:electron transfer flavoprotein alpha/beta subunit
LGWPQVGFAKTIELKGQTAVVTRSLEDCEEVIEVSCQPW